MHKPVKQYLKTGFNLCLISSQSSKHFLNKPLYLLKFMLWYMKKMIASSFLFCFLFFQCQVVNDQQTKNKPTNTNIEERINKQIKEDIAYYIECLNTKKFDELVEMIYPKLFGRKSKNDFKEELIKQNIFGVYKEIEPYKIESISPVHVYDGDNYVQIFCSGDVKLHVSGEAASTIERIKMELELSYDTSDSMIENNTIIIKDAYFSFIAISRKGSNFLWQYIEVDKQKEPFYDQIIPAEILDKF